MLAIISFFLISLNTISSYEPENVDLNEMTNEDQPSLVDELKKLRKENEELRRLVSKPKENRLLTQRKPTFQKNEKATMSETSEVSDEDILTTLDKDLVDIEPKIKSDYDAINNFMNTNNDFLQSIKLPTESEMADKHVKILKQINSKQSQKIPEKVDKSTGIESTKKESNSINDEFARELKKVGSTLNNSFKEYKYLYISCISIFIMIILIAVFYYGHKAYSKNKAAKEFNNLD